MRTNLSAVLAALLAGTQGMSDQQRAFRCTLLEVFPHLSLGRSPTHRARNRRRKAKRIAAAGRRRS